MSDSVASPEGIAASPEGIAASEVTCDGFLDNRFRLFQPRKGSHRAGLDALLLAATVPQQARGRLLDMGAGCGAAGFAVATRCPGLAVDLAEIDPACCALMHRSRALAENQPIAPRLSVIEADVADRRPQARLAKNSYDHIIANPPFNSQAHQPSPAAGRARAHVMTKDLLENWIRSASRLASPRARLALILRPESLPLVLDALEGRFGSPAIVPIHAKAGEPANRILATATQGGRASLRILPGLTIHQANGAFTDQAEEILRGRSGLAPEAAHR